MGLWQYFYEAPKQAEKTKLESEIKNKSEILKIQEENEPIIIPANFNKIEEEKSIIPQNLVISQSQNSRAFFENENIKGSINTEGLKIDNLELKKYKFSKNSGVSLLAPSQSNTSYFVQFGFTSNDSRIKLPNSKTIWKISKGNGNEFIARWENGQGILFETTISLDESYMFSISQIVKNKSGVEVSIAPFIKIFRNTPEHLEGTFISHEGFVGHLNGLLHEQKYDEIKKVKRMTFPRETETFWAGFADKYWLTTFAYNNEACFQNKCKFINSEISFNHLREQGEDKYQADFVTEAVIIPNNEQISFPSKVFSGAKELKLLDYYGAKGFTSNDKTYQLKQFDKTVDFGIFYFLTKPIFLLITFLNSFLHNFGFAIILLTIIIKLILFPIATKSYLSMGKMKALAPKIAQVKKEIGGNKLELNRRIMEIYKENKVNPLSGCLPLFLQIPVFFALYKVLYISIEMRGADFIFWITDLSMKDPTSIFNLFGLLPFSVPSFLQIGVLPILMGLTTYLQQSLSPKSGDEMQMMIIKFMPFILIFVFASFPAGIVLYWITNNVLSILQQLYVEKVMLPKAFAKNNKVSKIAKK
jgi:YidC/Oxa1 family membrane protein insertase